MSFFADKPHSELAKELGLPILIGAHFQVQGDAPFRLVAIATSLNGYGNLCELITQGRRNAEKGSYRLTWEDFSHGLPGCLVR